MGLKIIGTGFGRTGTMSTKTALEQLGFGPCHHMIEVMRNPEQPAYWAALAAGQEVDWAEVIADYTVAYIIFQNQVDDRELMARYIPQAIRFIYASGGEVVVFEEESQILEGPGDFPRTIVLRFNSRKEAESCYYSPAYRKIRSLQLQASQGTARIVDKYRADGG